MRRFIIVLVLATSPSIIFSQHRAVNENIPVGFTILDSASGDLDGDGYRDIVMVLKNISEEKSPEGIRPLLVLLGRSNNTYELIARNDSVVMCRDCGGIFGDPFAAIVVKKQFFSIEHYGGSNWRWTRIITFKVDNEKEEILLHRDAGESWHVSEPDKRSQLLYNKSGFGTTTFKEYRRGE